MTATLGTHEERHPDRADAHGSRVRDLRASLHDAAGPDRIAASRTRDSIEQLRARADFFRVALELYAGQPLGYWYAELATRLEQAASEIEADATANGIIGGGA